jgi:large-conductance mechanosensitive channel
MIRTITPIFSIIIALVVFFMYTKPMFADIKVIQNEAGQFGEAVEKAEELNRELARKLDQKRSYTAESLNRLEALVPEEIDEVQVLADLSEIARSHNMLFGNIGVSNTEIEQVKGKNSSQSNQTMGYENLTQTDIEFSLIGSYDQFKSFLADLESSLVLLEVVSIDFSAGEGTLQQYKLVVRLFALAPIE